MSLACSILRWQQEHLAKASASKIVEHALMSMRLAVEVCWRDFVASRIAAPCAVAAVLLLFASQPWKSSILKACLQRRPPACLCRLISTTKQIFNNFRSDKNCHMMRKTGAHQAMNMGESHMLHAP